MLVENSHFLVKLALQIVDFGTVGVLFGPSTHGFSFGCFLFFFNQ